MNVRTGRGTRTELGAEGALLILSCSPASSARILWNLLTWLFGLPSSSSHALFGGLIGAALAGSASSGSSG